MGTHVSPPRSPQEAAGLGVMCVLAKEVPQHPEPASLPRGLGWSSRLLGNQHWAVVLAGAGCCPVGGGSTGFWGPSPGTPMLVTS